MKLKHLIPVLLLTGLISCSGHQEKNEPGPQGKLFIIGGGKRPVEMVQSLVQIAGVDSAGYIIILPMSSEFPDTAIYYASKQFTDLGIAEEKVIGMHFQTEEDMSETRIDSVKNAALIYISGGDQARFMKIVNNTILHDAILEAHSSGSVIAGTSAGAAVMSKKMITGDQIKHPVYTGDFETIEANNIELTEGLGLISNAIIDQHFIKRSRMNRLISVCLENPEETCIGIDESTAILVENNRAMVYGVSQVVVMKHTTAETKIINGLLGGTGIELSIYLPGDKFLINP